MLTCREVTERANRYLDHELDFWSAMQVRMHLFACRYCRGFMKQMRTTIRLVREYGYTLPEDQITGQPGAFMSDEVMDALRRRWRDGAQ